MSGEVWVFAEHHHGCLLEITFEILGKGREIADKLKGSLSAILMGRDLEELTQELIDFGVDCVYLLDGFHPNLYPSQEMVGILCGLVRKYSPEILLMGATSFGAELAPKVAAKLHTGLSAHCIDLDVDEKGHLLQIVPAFGGGVLATITCPDQRPQMATVKSGVLKVGKKGSRNGRTVHEKILENPESGIKILETFEEEIPEVPLEKAEVVIAGGWGVGGREQWPQLGELAELLKGAVGATRPPVDEGWAKEFQMIGQSGKTVRPKLYIGFGISGVMHHMVGIQDCDFIIAVNNDPEAEIFRMCDFGVEGDLKEILPCLIQKIKEKIKK
jgi:electron transfer flavoprotein alpha subunit